jgi:hypothetical protein
MPVGRRTFRRFRINLKLPTGAQKSRPGALRSSRAALADDSGDDRLSRRSTIIGLAGLTAVFGMGTGVTPPVWSPENRPAGGQAGPGAFRWGWSHARGARLQCSLCFKASTLQEALRWDHSPIVASPRQFEADGSGWSSCLAVRTGRLRRSRAVHARPIDLVVFQEPSQRLLLETSSWRGLRA